jgi:hypothetical protein
MSQISPPIRILLVCAVAFMAAWMLFLRPSTDAGAPAADAPTPAASTPPVEAGGEKAGSLAGKAVEEANEATAKQNANAEKLAGGVGETAATPETTAAPATAATTTKTGAPAGVPLPTKEQLATLPPDVRRAIVKRKIIVLGVVSPKGADERLVRTSLDKVDRLHGRVFVKAVPVKKISRYGLITRGVDVSQTPTLVVVDFAMRASTIAGWVDVASIDQAVVDAIRYSGTLYTDAYVKQVAQACTHWIADYNVLLEAGSATEARRLVASASNAVTGLKRDIAAISTPKKWRSFSKATQADLAAAATTLASAHTALAANFTLQGVDSTTRQYGPQLRQAGKSLNARFDKHDILACGSKG